MVVARPISDGHPVCGRKCGGMDRLSVPGGSLSRFPFICLVIILSYRFYSRSNLSCGDVCVLVCGCSLSLAGASPGIATGRFVNDAKYVFYNSDGTVDVGGPWASRERVSCPSLSGLAAGYWAIRDCRQQIRLFLIY